ncbi:sensor histidine kinase [Paenibacillus endoradicis]|uniref:sensor histidine kinase n=1 Tax=Paenibacillus endoradicis TaxID=2972487 RepID=UPI0021593F91|nr:sensor histidine kinase [Paenibacillus endoradicis]MCR8659606.1 sensor histidine kinase [Paenibacillus endoradicis]
MRSKLRIGDMKMDRKLLLSFILLVTIPLSVVGYNSSSKYATSIEEKTIAYSIKMQESMMVRVDDYIEDMKSISSIPAYIDDIKSNLIRSNRYYAERQSSELSTSLPNNFDQLLSIQRGIEGQLSFINTIKRGANSVYLFDVYGNSYYSIVSGGIRNDLDKSYHYWLNEAELSRGEAVLLRTQKYTSNLQSERYAFSVVRKIVDDSLSVIGLIAIDADISIIEDQTSELDQVTKGASLIVDKEGNVIYDSEKKWIAINMSEHNIVNHALNKKGSFYLEKDGIQFLHIYAISNSTGWKIITSIPVTELTNDTIVVKRIIWITTAVAVLISIIVAIILSLAITRPLRTMTRLMKSVQEGNFKEKFPVKYHDEVGMLGSQFNRMIVRLDQLIQEIYEMETKKKKAELQALQNQINPHFMYNTLESIRMSAEMNDDSTTADMIAILGKLLRYSISNLNDETNIEEEMNHVQHYIELLNYRYPDRFQLVINVDRSVMKYRMIRLLLQPIIENAIYHGLDDNKGVMHLKISSAVKYPLLMIHIVDDGIGIETSKLLRLNSGLRDGSVDEAKYGIGGIGLKNVNERIKLQYGQQYGIRVESQLGVGTEVILQLPIGRVKVIGDESDM